MSTRSPVLDTSPAEAYEKYMAPGLVGPSAERVAAPRAIRRSGLGDGPALGRASRPRAAVLIAIP